MSNPTTENLLDIEADIYTTLVNLKDLTKLIKEVDDDYTENPTEDTKFYLFETIEKYKITVDKARILLEAYFQQEREDNIPTDFGYRALYKKLNQAY